MPRHLVSSSSQHVVEQVDAAPLHFVVGVAPVFALYPAGQVKSLHVATDVQHAVTAAVLEAAAVPALVASKYLSAPQLTEAKARHLVESTSQHVLSSQVAASPVHSVLAAEVPFFFIPAGHV
jgi:hypothetical protein